MNSNLKKELDKNRFSIVKYGLVYILVTTAAVLISLMLIKIEGESILEMVINYYFK
jgi:hypothetical protein